MWTFQGPLEDGMMDSDAECGGAINLSQRPSAANSPADSCYDYDDNDQTPPLVKALKQKQKELQQKGRMRDLNCGSKELGNGQTPSPTGHGNGLSLPHHHQAPPPLFPPNLHQQMQQLLQHQLLTPAQIQSFMQQQSLIFQQQQHHQLAEIGRKQLEQAIQNLQEQLQVNLLQQSHLLQGGSDKKKSSGALQQLGAQQHQLMSQLQLTQRQYLIQQGLNLPSLVMSSAGSGLTSAPAAEDLAALWKEGREATLSPLQITSLNGNSPKHPHIPNGFVGSRSVNGECEKGDLLEKSISHQIHPLYGHGVCKWPGCETVADDLPSFLKHLNTEHTLDDRSTAQARVQMQVVSQLEIQLAKERDRLQAMMHHLHVNKQQNLLNHHGNQSPPNHSQHQPCLESPKDNAPTNNNDHGGNCHGGSGGGSGHNNGQSLNKLSLNLNPNLLMSGLSAAGSAGAVSGRSPSHLQPNAPSNPSRRRISDKVSLQLSSGFDDIGPTRSRRIGDRSTLQICEGLPYLLERAGLDVASEIQRNREFYKVTDCRPPFTYASLIRQAIIESPDKQLTLNEIYNWFQNTFCYFRRNQATWKNAIRTNLSLHKCFVRYEDDFGSFWMVDDAEFVKRRHLSRGRPRKYDPTPSPSPSSHHPRPQGLQSKSPTQSPTLYGDSLNASLQAALAESNGPFISPLHAGNLSPDQAQSPLETRSRSSTGSPLPIKRETMSPSSNHGGIHHHGSFGLSSDGDSRDQDLSACGDKQEELAEDLSFPTPAVESSRFHQ